MISEKILDAIDSLAAANWHKTISHIQLRQSQLIAAIEAEIAERVAEAVKRKAGEIEDLRSSKAALIQMLEESRKKTAAPEHRPFDLEAAKRGEAIEYRAAGIGSPLKLKFIGMHGDLVVHVSEDERLGESHKSHFFMAPRPMRTVWLNLSISGATSIYQSKSEAESAEGLWASVAIELSIPVRVPAK